MSRKLSNSGVVCTGSFCAVSCSDTAANACRNGLNSVLKCLPGQPPSQSEQSALFKRCASTGVKCSNGVCSVACVPIKATKVSSQ